MNGEKQSVFEYGEYHFMPYRRFRAGEIKRQLQDNSHPQKIDMRYATRNMRTDFSLKLFSGERSEKKQDYSYGDFYDASTDRECDIFRCVENGRLYVPGANELFRYIEPKQRTGRNSYER
jgi:hypothetical protein